MRSRICAWMVTSSAVVGSSAISSLGRQESAMAIITRWRMPPESWWGYSSRRRRASGMPTRRSISIALSSASRRLRRSCWRSVSRELPPHRQHRIEAGHRLLEDHGDVVAAHAPHGAAREASAGRCPGSGWRRRCGRAARGSGAGWSWRSPTCRSRTRPPPPASRPPPDGRRRRRRPGSPRRGCGSASADSRPRAGAIGSPTAVSPCAGRACRAGRRPAGSPPAPSATGTRPGRTR